MTISRANNEKNSEIRNTAKLYAKELKQRATKAERIMLSIMKRLNKKVVFQHPIFIYANGNIKTFYIADFCDIRKKIILEVDGGYHKTEEQTVKDKLRTIDLKRLGYKVYRITNEDVFNGLGIQFVKDIYKNKKTVRPGLL